MKFLTWIYQVSVVQNNSSSLMPNSLGHLHVFFITPSVNNITRCTSKTAGKYFIKITKTCGAILVKQVWCYTPTATNANLAVIIKRESQFPA